jgi:flagellar hook-associated protein 3 FlgL
MIRVSDRNIQSTYLNILAKSKSDLATIQKQLVSQSKINKPSDEPLGTSRVIRMSSQIETFNVFEKNIDSGLAYIDNSSTSLEGIKDEIQKVLRDLTDANNATVGDNLSQYSDKIKSSLNSIMDLANTSFDGQFLFGGSDNSTSPVGYDASGDLVEFKSSRMDADHKIKISNYTEQKINMNSKELFASVLKHKGNLDSGSAVGIPETVTSSIYNSEGTEYSFVVNYTKTAANNYTMDYTVVDPLGVTVTTGSSALAFNSTTGALQTVDGNIPNDIKITDDTNKINLVFDLQTLSEKNSAATINTDLSQKSDIFNVLKSVSETLKNGTIPDTEQLQLISDFEKHLINKISELGSFRNRLTDTQELNKSQSVTLQELVSKEKDVDVAQLAIELQEKQYSLDLTYKISSTLLPKSLLDYL